LSLLGLLHDGPSSIQRHVAGWRGGWVEGENPGNHQITAKHFLVK
jgi:hypothetical protein